MTVTRGGNLNAHEALEQLKEHLGDGWQVVVAWHDHGCYQFGCSRLGDREILTPYFLEADTQTGDIAEAAEAILRLGEG